MRFRRHVRTKRPLRREHQKSPDSEISVYGEEKTNDTVRLCKMNLAVHGLEGDIREGNTYYEDLHNSTR